MAYPAKGISRFKQSFGGVLMFFLGLGMTGVNWDDLLRNASYYPKMAVLGPAFAVLGLALVAMPGYREERLAKGQNLADYPKYKIITPRWWAVLVVGLALGVANLAAMAWQAGDLF
jgi:hypothetical protein